MTKPKPKEDWTEKSCSVCGAMFQIQSRAQRLCPSCKIPSCPICGKVFVRRQKGHNYCSKTCGDIAKRKPKSKVRREKQCTDCGEIFAFTRNAQAYCPNCRFRICPECGKNFYPHPHNQKFCSPECYHAHRRKIGVKPLPRPRKERSPVKCPWCGNVTMRLPYELRYGIKFCDKECYLAYRKAQRLNEHQCRYFYMSKDWIKLRRHAKARDKYTCQICCQTFTISSRSLTVHHITPRETFLGVTDSLHPDADHPDNLISLCNSCHQKVHMGTATIIPHPG